MQNIGQFAQAQSVAHAVFGKSTLADILRSLTTGVPDIIIGRKTLAGGPEQKAVLQVEGQSASFNNATWTGPKPQISIYDSIFINDNVFSGDVVTNEHLKKQYGLVIGEEGVILVRQIVGLDNENNENNKAIRNADAELNAVIRSIMAPLTMSVDDFIALEKQENIDGVITNKQTEVQCAQKTKELKKASEPKLFPIPSEAENFKQILETNIDGIAETALEAVRSHVAKHNCKDAEQMMHESWLEIGAAYPETGDCPYCGQALQDRVLVDAYKDFFQ